jgi:hypothetical protein
LPSAVRKRLFDGFMVGGENKHPARITKHILGNFWRSSHLAPLRDAPSCLACQIEELQAGGLG